MDPTLEERAAALLRTWIAEQGATPATVAAELGIEPAAVERMVSGREPVELARLERVLGVLGVAPGEFFARLYGAAAAAPPAAAAAPVAAGDPPGDRPEQPISRREVEEVVASLRSMIDGMARMLDAERAAGKEDDR